jgi:hypothetical protein
MLSPYGKGHFNKLSMNASPAIHDYYKFNIFTTRQSGDWRSRGLWN